MLLLTELTSDIFITLISYLTFDDLLIFRSLCKRLRSMANDKTITFTCNRFLTSNILAPFPNITKYHVNGHQVTYYNDLPIIDIDIKRYDIDNLRNTIKEAIVYYLETTNIVKFIFDSTEYFAIVSNNLDGWIELFTNANDSFIIQLFPSMDFYTFTRSNLLSNIDPESKFFFNPMRDLWNPFIAKKYLPRYDEATSIESLNNRDFTLHAYLTPSTGNVNIIFPIMTNNQTGIEHFLYIKPDVFIHTGNNIVPRDKRYTLNGPNELMITIHVRPYNLKTYSLRFIESQYGYITDI